ncbi:hypothetical protein HBB16_07095 [Pseudonocardia sp. MCCB 268]|nr:hypothetical protein [Pseudonocardia cytotoxica]
MFTWAPEIGDSQPKQAPNHFRQREELLVTGDQPEQFSAAFAIVMIIPGNELI